MQTIKSFFNQALAIWQDSTGAGRLGIGLLLALCIAAVVGVGYWSAQPQYVTLADGLTPVQSDKVVSALDSVNIGYDLRGAGSIVAVDKQDLARAKIAVGKTGVQVAESGLDDTWSMSVMDPKLQDFKIYEAKERELERMIANNKMVVSAEVMIGRPNEEVFIRNRHQTTASVQLSLSPGAQLKRNSARSIARLVANSVEGLAMENVAISDTDGNAYSIDDASTTALEQEALNGQLEQEYADKIQSLLEDIVGFGNVTVVATVDQSFTDVVREELRVDPDEYGVVHRSEEKNTGRQAARAGSGVAGSTSNVQPSQPETNLIGSGQESESTNETRVHSEAQSTIKEKRTKRESLSVSVSVNAKPLRDEAGELPGNIQAELEKLAKTAVNFNEATDSITVQVTNWVEPESIEEPIAATIPWDQINEILKNVSLGVAALVALFIAFRSLKKFQPGPGSTSEVVETGGTSLEQLAEMVRENPEVFSRIIASWSSAGDTEPVERPENNRANRAA